MMEIATTPITDFDQVTNTSFLGKTDRGTYVYTGAASIVSISVFDLLLYTHN